jgi:hypothetical protein
MILTTFITYIVLNICGNTHAIFYADQTLYTWLCIRQNLCLLGEIYVGQSQNCTDIIGPTNMQESMKSPPGRRLYVPTGCRREETQLLRLQLGRHQSRSTSGSERSQPHMPVLPHRKENVDRDVTS